MSFFSTPMKKKNNQQIDLSPFHFHGMRTRERERIYGNACVLIKRKETENSAFFSCHRIYSIYRKQRNCLDYLDDQFNNRSSIYKQDKN
jgi:hypothetical protein